MVMEGIFYLCSVWIKAPQYGISTKLKNSLWFQNQRKKSIFDKGRFLVNKYL